MDAQMYGKGGLKGLMAKQMFGKKMKGKKSSKGKKPMPPDTKKPMPTKIPKGIAVGNPMLAK